MIKYARVTSNKILFELTNNKLNRKIEFIMKKRQSLFLKKKSIISRIIQKSRFFITRFNFFDYLVIFLIFLVLGFFIYNRLRRQSVWTNVRLSIENVDWWYGGGTLPKYWYANSLEVGNEVKDSFGQKIAEVINIDNYDQGGPYRMIFVDLKVKVDFDKNKNQYFYEFKPLTVGSSMVLNFPENQVRGLVIGVGEQKPEYIFKTIKISKTNVLDIIANQINVGDKSFDKDGNLVAEILEIKSSVTNWYEYSDIRGEMIKVYNPDYRNLLMIVKVKAFSTTDRMFYINNTVLKLGSKIWLQFPKLPIEDATIIEIID